MSTLKVEQIQHPDSSTPAISLDSSGGMSGSFPYPNRNLIYNGAMQVAQRGTSAASLSTSGYFTADRWQFNISNLGTWTQSLENDAPTGSGFSKSWKVLCTTAQASPSSSSVFSVRQRLEGQDLQRVRKGSSSADNLTLSFWVKSNVTGTYVIELYDLDNTRQVSASYSIAASGTWERKTATFPADVIGAFDNDNNGSLQLSFYLATGSELSSGTLNTSWNTATQGNRAAGQTNLAASVNNYWQITGVQLETGPVSTEFEHEPYGVTLAKCQRYFESLIDDSPEARITSGYAYSTTQVQGDVRFLVEKRSTPILTYSVGVAYQGPGQTTRTNITPLFYRASKHSVMIYASTSGLTTGYGYSIVNRDDGTGRIFVDAEL